MKLFILIATTLSLLLAGKIATASTTPENEADRDATVSIKPDTEVICAGMQVTFYAITQPLQNPVYQWLKNNQPVGGNTPEYAFVPMNGDILQVSVAANGFSGVSDPITLTVHPVYTSIAILASATQVTSGTPVTFNAETYNAGARSLTEWFVNDIRAAFGTDNFTYIPQNGDRVQARLTAGSDVPCLIRNPVTSNLITVSVCNAPPLVFNVWGSGEFCGAVGFEFGLESSEPGATYYLYKKLGDNLFPVYGMEQSGTGGLLSFFGEAGEYFILGKNACDSVWMNGSASVLPFNTKTYISAAGNNLCAGSEILYTATPQRSGSADYEFLWMVNYNQVFQGGTSFSYFPENGDEVSAIMISPCFDYEMNNTVVMMVRDCLQDPVIWTGTLNNDWDRPENWDSGVPGPASVVIIPGNLENFPTLTFPVSCESIIIEDGGSFIGSEYLTVKSAQVQRELDSMKFHFLSSPLTTPEPAFGGVFRVNQNSIWARTYDEYYGDWHNLTASDLLFPGRGYSMLLYQDQTAEFIGHLNSSPVNSLLHFNNPGNDPDRAGWNLLGNPYPSAIDWDSVSIYAGERSVYAWNGAQYISWNGTIGALTNGIVPPQGGVFVKAEGPGYIYNRNVTIPLEARLHSNRPFLKEIVANTLELEVEGNNHRDITFVRFNNLASKGFDPEADARKLRGIEEAPQLFTRSGTFELSINELPLVYNESIEIGFSCSVSGNYTFFAGGLSGFDASIRLLLTDEKTGNIADLAITPQYTFDYQAGEPPDRFHLLIADKGYLPENEKINFRYHDHRLAITKPGNFPCRLHIYDLTGREIIATRLDSGDFHSLPLNLRPGIYVLRFSSTDFQQSGKFIVY